MNRSGLDDVRYNVLIGGDGSIFEGRGFNGIGEHTPNHNNNSLGIALIGKFDVAPPPDVQVVALRKLLQFGLAWEHLRSNYELFGYDQLVPDAGEQSDVTTAGTADGKINKKKPLNKGLNPRAFCK